MSRSFKNKLILTIMYDEDTMIHDGELDEMMDMDEEEVDEEIDAEDENDEEDEE